MIETYVGYNTVYSNSWALIIGINKYSHVSPLDYAVNDAKAIAQLLEEKFKFPEENIKLLVNENATKEKILDTFLGFTKRPEIKDDDRLIVFFAGHGFTTTGKRGDVGFLVPVNGESEKLDTLIRWDELTRNGDLIPAKHIFFLMDACYGGLALQRSPSFGSMRFLGDMLQRYTRQVLTAGKANETVSDGNGTRPGHSIFTSHLLDGLEGGAQTQDGIITASGIMAYVYEHVSKDQYSKQTPHYGFVEGDGDFIFDTKILDKLKNTEDSVPEKDNRKGEQDIIINTSPQLLITSKDSMSTSDQVKELLSDPTKRIKLDDYVSLYIRRFLEATDLRNFPVQGLRIEIPEFVERLQQYEAAIKDLQEIVILLSKWGNSEHLILLQKIFTRIIEADRGSSGGLILWLRLIWYPVLVLMYSAGISALASNRYDVLKIILQTAAEADPLDGKGRRPIVVSVIEKMNDISDSFKQLPGLEQKYVPRSEHLFKILQPTLEDLLFLGRSYDSLFDRFEIFVALVYGDILHKEWGPPGRFAWKHVNGIGGAPFEEIAKEAAEEKENWMPIQAGFFGSSPDRAKHRIDTYRALIHKFNWW